MNRRLALPVLIFVLAIANTSVSQAAPPAQQVGPASTIAPPQTPNGPRIEPLGENKYKMTVGGPIASAPMQQAAGLSTFATAGTSTPFRVELPAIRGQSPIRLMVSGNISVWPKAQPVTQANPPAQVAAQAAAISAPCTYSVSTDTCPPVQDNQMQVAAAEPVKPAPASPPPASQAVFVNGEFTLQPVGMFVVAGDSSEQSLPGVNALAAQGNATSGNVAYALGSGVQETYLATASDLNISLRFENRDAFKDVSVSSEQRVESRYALTLPAGYTLFANGQTQSGNFETAGGIELRDAQDNTVLVFSPVVLSDQNANAVPQTGSYRVTRAGDTITLAESVPLTWLAAQERMMPAAVDAYFGLTPPAMDTFLRVAAPNSIYGLSTDLWVSESGPALVKWNVSGLPQKAMIDTAWSFLGYYNATGADTVTVYAHHVLSDWNESQATYNQRLTGVNWFTAGGDYDAASETSSVLTGSPPASQQTPWWWLQPMVADWHSGRWSNYGLLFRGVPSVAGNFNKIFYAKESSAVNRFVPQLDVYYTLGPITVTQNTQNTRIVPSPDWYAFDSGSSPANNMWQGFVVEPAYNSDQDLFLLADGNANLGNTIASSTGGAAAVDYILIDRNHAPAGYYYPAVTEYSGRDGYTVEYTRRNTNAAITSPAAQAINPATDTDIMEVHDLDLIAGKRYSVTVRPTAGNPDIEIALHASNPATSSTWYQGKSRALIYSNNEPIGKAERFSFAASSSDRYGLVVLTKYPNAAPNYTIYLDDTPPAGTFSINNGAAYVNTQNVTLNSMVTDSGTGMNDMRFRASPPLKALMFRDTLPWGYNAIPDALSLADVQLDILGSGVMTTTDLSPYTIVIIPSVQGDAFCQIYNSNAARFASFVQGGGTLIMQSTGFSGESCAKTIPGGAGSAIAFDNDNTVVLPSHPIVAGLPITLTGSSASHGYLTNLPAGSTIIVRRATGASEPTLAEWNYGSGRVIASTLTDEFYWSWSDNDIAKVLTNKLNYAANQAAYANSQAWTLPAGDGVKTVYGEFRNNAGMWTPLQSDTIVLDTVAPASQASSPERIYKGNIEVSWSAGDATSPVSNVSLWVKFNNGAWANSGLPPQTGTSGTFTYQALNGEGDYAFATVATDNATNVEATPTGGGDSVTRFGLAKIFVTITTNNWCPLYPLETEDNSEANSADGPLCFGFDVQGYANDRSDYFYFNLTRPSTVQITLENHPGEGNSPLQLQLKTGPNAEFTYPDYVFKAPYVYTKVLMPGRYFVRVVYGGTPNYTQLYRLRVSLK